MKNIKTYETYNQDVLNHDLLYYSNKIASLNKIRELLSNGADPNCRNELSLTPLYISCGALWYATSKFLIENGADVNLAAKNNMTPFYNLAYMSKYAYRKHFNKINKIIDILIENGADLSIHPTNTDWVKQANENFVEYVKEKHPDAYQNYLMKKDANKYNL